MTLSKHIKIVLGVLFPNSHYLLAFSLCRLQHGWYSLYYTLYPQFLLSLLSYPIIILFLFPQSKPLGFSSYQHGRTRQQSLFGRLALAID